MGATKMRLGKVTPRSVSGSKSLDMAGGLFDESDASPHDGGDVLFHLLSEARHHLAVEARSLARDEVIDFVTFEGHLRELDPAEGARPAVELDPHECHVTVGEALLVFARAEAIEALHEVADRLV